jgi:hypothetical protein
MANTKEELLDELDAARERLLVALEYVPDEALVEPRMVMAWSIADLLSILTAWDAEVVTGLMQLKRGQPPQRLLAALDKPQVYNAARYAENQDRDLDAIFDDFQGARVKLEEWIEEFNDRALTAKGHYKTLGNRSVLDLIHAATVKHEATYLPILEAIGRQWADEAEAADASGETIIPLLTIEPTEPTGNGHHPE